MEFKFLLLTIILISSVGFALQTNLQKGWNIVSINDMFTYAEQNPTELRGVLKATFAFTGSEYVSPLELSQTKGKSMWVYMSKSISIPHFSEILDFTSKGWNFVTYDTYLKIQEKKCDVEKAFSYDSLNNEWVSPASQLIGVIVSLYESCDLTKDYVAPEIPTNNDEDDEETDEEESEQDEEQQIVPPLFDYFECNVEIKNLGGSITARIYNSQTCNFLEMDYIAGNTGGNWVDMQRLERHTLISGIVKPKLVQYAFIQEDNGIFHHEFKFPQSMQWNKDNMRSTNIVNRGDIAKVEYTDWVDMKSYDVVEIAVDQIQVRNNNPDSLVVALDEIDGTTQFANKNYVDLAMGGKTYAIMQENDNKVSDKWILQLVGMKQNAAGEWNAVFKYGNSPINPPDELGLSKNIETKYIQLKEKTSFWA